MGSQAANCRLDGRDTTLVFAWTDGPPALLYHGTRLPQELDLAHFSESRTRPVPHAGLDVNAAISLVPEAGRGFLGYPGLRGRRKRADWDGLLTMNGTQAIENGIQFRLADGPRQIAVTVDCHLDPETDVAVFRSRIKNQGEQEFDANWLSSGTLVPMASLTQAVTFHGRWCAEFETLRQDIQPGLTVKENRRGRTSHDSFPGLILASPSTDQNSGECLGAHLGWSGNHRIVIERLATGDTQVQLGVLFEGGEGQLKSGEIYCTPALYVARSQDGFNGLSHKFHDHVRRRLLRFPDPDKPRPVIVNTWEALYFDHNWQDLSQLVDAAKTVGAERFVLDDGWFRGRADDRAGLGDWFADADKYPTGLKPLADYVRQNGMEFGLWVEPEMVNPASQLLRDHPDWILSLPPYPTLEGRNQLVLDLSNGDVVSYLFACLSDLISENGIAYLKWDMNRDLVLPGNAEGYASACKQTTALYELLDRIRLTFPDLEIESCASGGGRVDYGILERTHRFWPSDSNDAVERAAVQAGFSYFFPPEVMGAHIGPQWSHTSGRGLDATFRALVAGCGHLGIEADLRSLSEADRTTLAQAVARYKKDRNLWHCGRFYRVETADPALTGFAAISCDQNRGQMILIQTARPRASLAPIVPINGLAPDKLYRVTITAQTTSLKNASRQFENPLSAAGLVLQGAVLANAGLMLPVFYAQSALLLSFDAILHETVGSHQ